MGRALQLRRLGTSCTTCWMEAIAGVAERAGMPGMVEAMGVARCPDCGAWKAVDGICQSESCRKRVAAENSARRAEKIRRDEENVLAKHDVLERAVGMKRIVEEYLGNGNIVAAKSAAARLEDADTGRGGVNEFGGLEARGEMHRVIVQHLAQSGQCERAARYALASIGDLMVQAHAIGDVVRELLERSNPRGAEAVASALDEAHSGDSGPYSGFSRNARRQVWQAISAHKENATRG